MLLPNHLQEILRKFEPLRDVEVVYESEERGAIAPFVMLIRGYITLHGELRAYETEIDTRNLETAEDILKLVGSMVESFNQAAEQIRKKVA